MPETLTDLPDVNCANSSIDKNRMS